MRAFVRYTLTVILFLFVFSFISPNGASAAFGSQCFTVFVDLTVSPSSVSPGDTLTFTSTVADAGVGRTLNVLIDPNPVTEVALAHIDIPYVRSGSTLTGQATYTIPTTPGAITNGVHTAEIWNMETPSLTYGSAFCGGHVTFTVTGGTTLPPECVSWEGLLCAPWQNNLPPGCENYLYCKCTGTAAGCFYGLWIGCGHVGESCCQDAFCPAADATCNPSTLQCDRCGGEGESCCSGAGETPETACIRNDLQLQCINGSCETTLPKVYCDANGDPTAVRTDRLNTALGCLEYTSATALSIVFLRISLGVLGGIILLMIVVASIMILTSTGDPKRLAAGNELLVSVITGAIMVLFSVMILHLIGVRILGIF